MREPYQPPASATVRHRADPRPVHAVARVNRFLARLHPRDAEYLRRTIANCDRLSKNAENPAFFQDTPHFMRLGQDLRRRDAACTLPSSLDKSRSRWPICCLQHAPAQTYGASITACKYYDIVLQCSNPSLMLEQLSNVPHVKASGASKRICHCVMTAISRVRETQRSERRKAPNRLQSKGAGAEHWPPLVLTGGQTMRHRRGHASSMYGGTAGDLHIFRAAKCSVRGLNSAHRVACTSINAPLHIRSGVCDLSRFRRRSRWGGPEGRPLP